MIADRGGIAPELARRHREAGGEVVVVTFGDEYREIEPGWFQIRAGEPRDVQMLCSSPAAARVPEAIVHLAGLDAPAGEAFDVEVLCRAQMAGAYSLPSIVQGLVEARWSPSPRLWMVTRGVHSVGLPAGTETCLASAPLWGLARTLTNEIPELRCSLIDLSPVGDEAELDSLYRELAHRGEETEVVLAGRGDTFPAWPAAPRGWPRVWTALTRSTSKWIHRESSIP